VLCCSGCPVNAQIGPIQTSGSLEYQYQQNSGPDIVDSTTQLGTWRAKAATYFGAPWLVQLDGSIGLTRTFAQADIQGDGRRSSTLLTGALHTGIFQQSPFPVRAFVERLDSRVDNTISDLGLQSTTIGTIAQLTPKGGGSYSLNFRNSDTDRLTEDSTTFRRAYSDSLWQADINKSLGRNDFRVTSLRGQTERYERNEALKRTTHNLRHKFRTSPRFYTDSTLFVSDESLGFDENENLRRFQQFNGIATWRPETARPLMITTRALLQDIETGSAGIETNTQAMAFTALASLQKSDRTTWSADIGVIDRDAELGMQGSSVFQRLRTNHRSVRHQFGKSDYRWGGVFEMGNRRNIDDDVGAVQEVLVRLDHSLSRNAALGDDRQLQISFAQQFADTRNTLSEQVRVFTNSVFGTYVNQGSQLSTYLRLSATDRRASGDQVGTNQLLNLQASAMAQSDRRRAWNGNVTLQYGRTLSPIADAASSRRETVSYSADLMYRQTDIFNVSLLNFTSELRLLSENFITDNPLDADLGIETERVDAMWRNRLSYRLGLLEFDLHATFREINNDLSTRVFFKVRRFYGAM
jgi:hypothetical protein